MSQAVELPCDINELLEILFPALQLKNALPANQRFKKGDTVTTAHHIGVVQDDGESCHALKIKYGVIKKVEKRTARVQFEGEQKVRRLRTSELMPPPERDDDGKYPAILYIPVSEVEASNEQKAVLASDKKRNRKSGAERRKDKGKWDPEKHEERRDAQEEIATATPAEPSKIVTGDASIDAALEGGIPLEVIVDTVSERAAEAAGTILEGTTGEDVDPAMDSLAAWISMGEEMMPKLVERREVVLTKMAAYQHELRKIDVALKMFGKAPTTEPQSTPRRDPEKAKRVRNLVRRVCSGATEGLSSAAIATAVDSLDSGVDRYDVHNALSQMHRRGMIGRTGTRGSYVYSVPSGAALE